MTLRSFSWESVVHGHHIYKEIWTPVRGEVLTCEQEHKNSKDLFAVSVMNDGNIVGHVPCKVSRIV